MKGSGIFNIGTILHTDTCIENVISVTNRFIQFLCFQLKNFDRSNTHMFVFPYICQTLSLNEIDVFHCCLKVKQVHLYNL